MSSQEYDAFTRLVGRVLSVPGEKVKARVGEHRERAKRNPRRPGPKPKLKASASDPSDQPDRA